MKTAVLFLAAASLALTSCPGSTPGSPASFNASAALNGDLPLNPLRWRVITSGVDSADSAMFTLFGNDAAIQHARSSVDVQYPSGSVLALVTWREQEDSRWFGGRIPAHVKSVEIVEAALVEGRASSTYHAYEGAPLKQKTCARNQADVRTAYLFSLRAAVMP